MKVTIISIVIGAFGTVIKYWIQEWKDLEITGPRRNFPNDSIVEIAQNTKMSPGDLQKLAVTQIPV